MSPDLEVLAPALQVLNLLLQVALRLRGSFRVLQLPLQLPPLLHCLQRPYKRLEKARLCIIANVKGSFQLKVPQGAI